MLYFFQLDIDILGLNQKKQDKHLWCGKGINSKGENVTFVWF